MSIPITGLLLIPLGVLLVFLPWRYCLAGLMVFAMMSPAAVVNAGGFGLEPGYYLALLAIARTFVAVMASRFTLNAFVLSSLRPLFYFLAVVFLVLFVALCFFQGDVATLPGTAGFKSTAVQPFHLGRNNFTQIAYLLVNICFLYCLAHEGARRNLGTLLKDWDRAILCGAAFAVAVCLWQFASFYAGIYFPADFFYSNVGYGRADSQTMAGLLRINGPFEEPSTLGYVFTGYLLFAWVRYRVHPNAVSLLTVGASVFCMAVSTSTTAMIGLLLFALVAGFDVVTGRLPLLANRSGGHLAGLALVIVGIFLGGMVVAANSQAIWLILQNILFDKADSVSFQQRSFADLLALDIAVETYGLGIGLGSHKANSLFLTLLSNTGIAGLVLFASFIYALLCHTPADLDRREKKALRRAFSPFKWGLAGIVLIHVFSNPNLSALTLWLHMGGLLALQASLRRTAYAQNMVHARQELAFDGRSPVQWVV